MKTKTKNSKDEKIFTEAQLRGQYSLGFKEGKKATCDKIIRRIYEFYDVSTSEIYREDIEEILKEIKEVRDK